MEIFKESVIQKDKFRNAANKLLNNCFIIKKKQDLRNDYIFILQNKNYFEEYFDLLGYELKINENTGVIGLSNYNGTGRLRLKKIESILLLILRLLYIEKNKELGLSEDVMIFSEDIHEKYNMLKIESKPYVDKTTFKDAIRLFRKYNIVATIDNDITQADARIKIYPSVLFALSGENINTLHESINNRLNKYANGGESEDDEDINED